MFRSVGIASLFALSFAAQAIPAAAATQVFSFTEADPSAGLGLVTFGTVSVTENAGGLDFLVSLADGYRFHETKNNNHNAFTFSLAGDPNVTISGLANGFAGVRLTSNSNVPTPPFAGDFTAISCNAPACGHGYNGGFAGPLPFRVTSSSALLTLDSLASGIYQGKTVFFTADLVRSNGKTGNVGATMNVVTGVPEPEAWMTMILGLGVLGGSMRRRTAKKAKLAFI